MDLIRRKVLSFLWGGNKDKPFFHTNPKKLGGLRIKNIYHFGEAPVAKSLWRGLFFPGLWHEVLKVKYLKHKLVDDWIRGITNSKRKV